MEDKQYVKELESFIGKLLKPIKDLPFSVLISGITGYKVQPYDEKEAKKPGFYKRLVDACIETCKITNRDGIYARRVNEVGNYIERYVINALNSVGMKARIPKTKDGSKKATGYPDIYVEDIDGSPFYLECKTYNKKSIDTTFRSFYVSPSKNPKITTDALHLMVGFEIVNEIRDNKTVFIPVYWKLYSLESLKGQIKHEFNASNKDLYTMETKIAEGDIKKAKNN